MFDLSLLVDITLTPGFAIAVGAGIHRIGEYLVDGGIGGRGPANLLGLMQSQGKVQSLGVKPQPNPARRTQFGKALEYCSNGGDYRRIGVKKHLAVFIAPDEADGQSPAQFATGGLVADTAVETCPQDMEFRFAHRALEPQYETIIE